MHTDSREGKIQLRVFTLQKNQSTAKTSHKRRFQETTKKQKDEQNKHVYINVGRLINN